MLTRNNNPIGTIKAGVCARGVDVGEPRCPGHSVAPADSEHQKKLVVDIAQAEEEIVEELAVRSGTSEASCP